jgi:uncharacterized protein YciI
MARDQSGSSRRPRLVASAAALLAGATVAQNAPPPAAGASAAAPATPAAAAPGARDVRFVVFHRPGPAWLAGKSMFEQPGIRDHVAHYRRLLAAGKLVLGGPHLDGPGGGMMIPAPGVPEDEIRAFAADDPAVKSGLLLVDVRPWLIGLSR